VSGFFPFSFLTPISPSDNLPRRYDNRVGLKGQPP
jgi:hypothetical protein